MMMNDSSLFYWRSKSLLFNALWHHKLQRHHIRNRLIRVRKGCAFHWCIDCGKYCCLICRGRKLLGWPSYMSEGCQKDVGQTWGATPNTRDIRRRRTSPILVVQLMTSTSTSSVLQTVVLYTRPYNSHNYKGFYSVVFMAFVDADCKFIWAEIGGMGSVWNAQIYSASGLRNALKMVIYSSLMLILFPNFPKTTRMCSNSSDF